MCCRKISEIRPEDGAPIATPSCWDMIWLLCVKQLCFVMTSYQLSSSCCVCGVVGLCVRILVRIFLVSFTGMLVCSLVMSREASLWCGSMGGVLKVVQ